MANPIADFWGRITPRERVSILALVLTFFVVGTVALVFMRAQKLSETENAIERHAIALNQVYTRGSVYQDKLREKERKETKIATEPLAFLSLVEQVQAGVEGVSVSDQEELTPVELGGGVIKRTFEFRLRSVTLEAAGTFLTKLESQDDRVILTERLEVRSTSSTEDRLNVAATIATWERRPEGDLGAGAEGGGS